MKKDDLIILLIGLLLLAAMLITVFFGGSKSLHGVGLLRDGERHTSIPWRHKGGLHAMAPPPGRFYGRRNL